MTKTERIEQEAKNLLDEYLRLTENAEPDRLTWAIRVLIISLRESNVSNRMINHEVNRILALSLHGRPYLTESEDSK